MLISNVSTLARHVHIRGRAQLECIDPGKHRNRIEYANPVLQSEEPICAKKFLAGFSVRMPSFGFAYFLKIASYIAATFHVRHFRTDI
jgi:hypothetical protein